MQLKDALNVVWEVEESEESGLWHFARNYMLSFAAVLALGFLLLVSLLVTAALAAVGKFVAPFGAAASIVVVLIWVYYTSQIVLMGAEITHSYPKHNGSLKRRDPPPSGEGDRAELPRPTTRGERDKKSSKIPV